MAAVDDPRTLGRARLTFASEPEIDEFVATLERFERGELTPDEWRAFRLIRGTYGQRQTGDAQMLRVKVPQGIATAAQLLALAEVGEAYSRGFGHITTRENVQFHFVRLHDVEPAMRALAEAGLTTREACGNSVRNITTCAYAGVARDETFDVTPYAEALTRYLLRHPLSSTLPRKFKIAFEGCAEDHVATAINDLGWRAAVRMRTTGRGPAAAFAREARFGEPRRSLGQRREAGRHGTTVERGFRVTAGGGTAIDCRSGQVLFAFLPAGDILNVAEAILRVFHRLGDREHRQRNRMKFLIKALGWDRWRAEVDQALAEVRAEGGARLPFDPDRPPAEAAPDWPRPSPPSIEDIARRAASTRLGGPGLHPDGGRSNDRPLQDRDLARWLETNVRAQKQDGYLTATVTLPLGDVTGAQLRTLADLSLAYGDGTVRFTHEQNVALRWIPGPVVSDLYNRLAAAGLGLPDAGTIADITSCPGAESCRLAVTQSRGLGRLLGDHLRAHPPLVAAAPDLKIKISGCPNGCGQHHIAGLGFQGSVRKLGDKAVPQYFVMVGGALHSGGASFARLAAKVPVRRLQEVVTRLMGLYQAERSPGETATAFFCRIDVARVKATLADLERLTAADVVPSDFVDLGEEREFTPEVMEGECAV
jgi:sulfite reductase beta subunit-like hemoprotein